MSITIATLKSKTHSDVDVTCDEYGGDIHLRQDDDIVILDNATLQQLWLLIESEMKHR